MLVLQLELGFPMRICRTKQVAILIVLALSSVSLSHSITQSDSDGDGVQDEVDNCYLYNPAQAMDKNMTSLARAFPFRKTEQDVSLARIPMI